MQLAQRIMSAPEQHERRPPDEDTSNGRLTPISATMHDVHRWLQRSLGQQARNEALLHITRLQSHAWQIELEMELARVEATRWGRHSKEAHALVQDSELDHEALLN
jgi:hypothetical protein